MFGWPALSVGGRPGPAGESPIRGPWQASAVSDQRLGATIRLLRIRRGWRQSDLAARVGVSQMTISRAERGHLGRLSLECLRAIGHGLDLRVDVSGRWRAGDLDRLLNAAHAALHEQVARAFATLPVWSIAPEVSFSVYGERGVIDILAWHAGRRALLVIELKTDVVDVNELVGTADRKRRLAIRAAAGRGWPVDGAGLPPPSVSLWLIVAAGRTNRRRVAEHTTMLRAAFPDGGRGLAGWLRSPVGELRALSSSPGGPSSWPGNPRSGRTSVRPVRRVRVPATGAVVRAGAGGSRGGGGRSSRPERPRRPSRSGPSAPPRT